MKAHRHARLLWGAMLALVVLIAVAAPWLSPHDPTVTATQDQFATPDTSHWLGTDQFGRDVLSRALAGARWSLWGASLSTLVAIAVGLTAGSLAGAAGGWLDWLLMRGVDILLALPGLLLAMVLVAIFGAGVWQAALGVGLSLAPGFSRLVRAAVLSVRVRPFVEASRALGAGRWFILLRHLLPNTLGPVLGFVTAMYAWSLLNMAALDFLGLTGSPSTPSWGRMLNEGRAYLLVAPWIAIAPGVMLTLSVLAVTGLSDAWRRGLPGRT